MFTAALFINSLYLENTHMPISSRVNEWTEPHPDNGILPSNKNEWSATTCTTQMDLEDINIKRWSQTQTRTIWFHLSKGLVTDTLPLVTLGKVVTGRGHKGSFWGSGMFCFLMWGWLHRCAHLWRFIKLSLMTCAFFCSILHLSKRFKLKWGVGEVWEGWRTRFQSQQGQCPKSYHRTGLGKTSLLPLDYPLFQV